MRKRFEYPALKYPRHFHYGPRPALYLPLQRGFSAPGVFDMAAMGYPEAGVDWRAQGPLDMGVNKDPKNTQ